MQINLEVIDKFLENYDLPRLNQEKQQQQQYAQTNHK